MSEGLGNSGAFLLRGLMGDAESLVGDLVHRLPIIRRIQNLVWGGVQPVDARLPIDEVVAIVRSEWNVQIDVLQVPFDAKHLVSLVERKSHGKFMIAVREDAPFVERRFGTIKEICHIVGDEEVDYQPHGEKTLAGILGRDTAQLYDKTLDLGGDGRGVASEKRAERMAEELIYDHRLRMNDTRRVKEGELGPTGLATLSSRYGIPHGMAVRVTRPLALELMRGLWATCKD